MLRRCLAMAFFIVSCGQSQVSTTRGLDTEHSNISFVGSGAVERIQVEPNTKIPKGVMVSLTSETSTFVADLYDLIAIINETESLSGLDGEDQEITLVALTSTTDRFASLADDIRLRRHWQSTRDIPYLAKIVGDFNADKWMQDWGEFSTVWVEGHTEPVHGVIDTGRYASRSGIDPSLFSDVFGTPFVNLSEFGGASGNYGGNIEATHEGKLYVGDTIDEGLADELQNLGNTDMLTLSADWLYVGHIDEYITFVPARDRCGAALFYADPLLAMTTIASLDNNATSLLDFSPSEIKAGLDHFRNPEAPESSTDLADYDLDRSGETMADAYVRFNLHVMATVQFTTQKLVAESSCLQQIIGLPQVFTDAWRSYSIPVSNAMADLPGVTNSLVLRNHVIVPDPKVAELRELTRDRLALATGDHRTIHFIDDMVYHRNEGEVHCGTNVVREPNMTISF